MEGTALGVMHIFVDWEVEWEQMHEGLLAAQVDEVVDKVVDARHGVDNGENFDFNSNLDG